MCRLLPRRRFFDLSGSVTMAAHLDKPRKQEAAGVLVQSMAKMCRRLGQQLRQGSRLKGRMTAEAVEYAATAVHIAALACDFRAAGR